MAEYKIRIPKYKSRIPEAMSSHLNRVMSPVGTPERQQAIDDIEDHLSHSTRLKALCLGAAVQVQDSLQDAYHGVFDAGHQLQADGHRGLRIRYAEHRSAKFGPNIATSPIRGRSNLKKQQIADYVAMDQGMARALRREAKERRDTRRQGKRTDRHQGYAHMMEVYLEQQEEATDRREARRLARRQHPGVPMWNERLAERIRPRWLAEIIRDASL